MRIFTQEHKKKLSEVRKKLLLEGKINPPYLGKKHSIGAKEKMRKAKIGKPHPYFIGRLKTGKTALNHRIRTSFEYKLWREAVFKRDNWTCVWCKIRGVKLNADHIKPFAYFPELRFAIDNGRTLCVPCHKTTDTWCRQNYKKDPPPGEALFISSP